MPIWTLQHADTVKPLHEWGLTQCVISEKSLSMGLFTASLPGNMLRTVPWEFEDSITLRLGDVVKFRGVTLSPTRQAAGSSEMMTLRFADAWYYLMHGSYLQGWKNKDGEDFSAGIPALFADVIPGVSWAKRTIGAEIAAIITQANAYHGGSVMELGDLLGDGFESKPIPQRVQNVSYETVLRQVLAWVPDAIHHWEYEEDELPRLHFVQREAATARTYSFADGTAMVDEQFIRRDDLVVRGVEINYMGRSGAYDVVQRKDAAGATTGTRILRSVIDCGGNAGAAAPITPTPTPEKKRDFTVVTTPLAYLTAQWWFDYGDTGAATVADIVVGSGSDMEFAEHAPENEGYTDLGGCGLQWLSGGIPKNRVRANTRVALVTGYLTVRTVTTETAEATPILTTEVRERRIVKMLVPVTKLNGDYEQILEEPGWSYNGTIPKMMGDNFISPSGVAQVLFDAWKDAQHDGSFTVVKTECDEAVQMGDVINITDGLDEWETMRTQVQGITREIGTGTTTITTGTAAHLGVDEYLNQLRMNRMRNVVVAADLDEQTTGAPAEDTPDPDELDDMVGPGSIKYSVLHGPQELIVTRANAEFKMDLKAETGPTVAIKSATSGDTAALEPGKTVVENTVAESSITTTPEKIEIKDGVHCTTEISSTLFRQENAAGDVLEISIEDGIKFTMADGKILQLDILRLLLDNGDGKSTTMTHEGVVIVEDDKDTELTINRLYMSDGGGKTMLVNEEQVVINGDGHNVMLDITDALQVDFGSGSTLSAKPTGVEMVVDSQHADLSPANGVHLADGGTGAVDIKVVAAKQIEIKETNMCEEEDGLPVPKKAQILRSETEAV